MCSPQNRRNLIALIRLPSGRFAPVLVTSTRGSIARSLYLRVLKDKGSPREKTAFYQVGKRNLLTWQWIKHVI
jgi:hypothetical protein